MAAGPNHLWSCRRAVCHGCTIGGGAEDRGFHGHDSPRYQYVDTRGPKTLQSIVRRFHNRFSRDVKGGVQQDRYAATAFKCLDDGVQPWIGLAAERLHPGAAIDMSDGSQYCSFSGSTGTTRSMNGLGPDWSNH